MSENSKNVGSINLNLVTRSLDTYGLQAQISKMGEEAAELAAAIMKFKALRDYQVYAGHDPYEGWVEDVNKAEASIMEELADVQIMMSQMIYIFEDKITPFLEAKKWRAFERLEALS